MHTRILPLAALLLTAPLLVPPGAAAPITVTFDVDFESYPVVTEAGSVTCTVTVAAGGPVAQLLDAATAQGCITGWEYDTHPEYGRFITSIHDREQLCDALVVCFWWAIEVDGQQASQGVDFEPVVAGRDYAFVYTLTTVADWI